MYKNKHVIAHIHTHKLFSFLKKKEPSSVFVLMYKIYDVRKNKWAQFYLFEKMGIR